MKKTVCILLCCCFMSIYSLQALNYHYNVIQSENPVDDIKTMFNNEQYQDIIEKYASAPRNLSCEELTYIAQSYMHLDDLSNAQKYIDMAIQKNTKDSKAYYAKGIICNMAGNSSQAIESLKKAITLSPKQAEYYVETGDVYFSQDNYNEALINYRKATKFPNPSEKAFYMIGAVYAAQDNLKNALDTFYVAKSKIVKDKELYVTTLYNIGNIEYDNKNYKKAAEAYQELTEYFPDDFHSLEKMVQCYNTLGYYARADVPKGKLYAAYNKGLLSSSSLSDMFCIDQFTVGDKSVSAYERFEDVTCRSYVKNIFYIADSHGNIESIISLKYIPSEEGGKSYFELLLEKGSEQYRFNTVFEEGVKYNVLQPYIVEIVEGKKEAIPVVKE